MHRLVQASRFEEFVGGLRSPVTWSCYGRWLVRLLGDPDGFLESAGVDRRGAEDHLIDYVKRRRDVLSSASIRSPLAAVKSFWIIMRLV